MSAFDKVIGYESIKAELIRYCDVLRNPEKYWKLGVKRPSGILLYGEPGIGKTLMAEAFIEESGCKAFVLRKNKPDGSFVDEIRETFKTAASHAPCIVFLDDMDKYANEDMKHRDADEYVSIQSCIDEVRGKCIFVIATVNDKYCLPDSLLRVGRFDKVIEMENPYGDDAVRIIEHYLRQKQVMGNINARDVARILKGRTCAELENAINEAGIYAGYEGRDKIEQKDIIKACMRVVFDYPEGEVCDSPEFERNVAVHEAGHALVSEYFDRGSVSLISVHGRPHSFEGVTITGKGDTFFFKKQKEEEVICKLAGKAATEMVFGIADQGCSLDVSLAFDMVCDMVDDFCCFGFNSFEQREPSGFVLENRDRLSAVEMERCYQKAKKIIAENRGKLDALVEALLKQKTLMSEEIAKIMAA